MDKCREAFEKLPEINAILHNSEFGFNEDINQYYHPNHTEHRLNYAFLMGAWIAWQSRQAKVDEKDKRIQEALNLFKKDRSGHFESLYDLLDELEKALRGDNA